MAKADITTLDRDLKRGTIRPLYALVGPEGYLAREGLRLIQEAAEREGTVDLQTSAGREAREEAVLGALCNISLMGGRSLVVVREAERMPKSTVTALADYAAEPAAGATLVLIAEKLDGRTKLMQAIAKNGAVIECKPLYADKVPYWVNMQVKRGGKAISQEAARFLADMIGSDMGQLAQAIERVILYVGEKPTIELGDVEQAVAETHQRTIFELTDAVGERDLSKALALLRNLLEHGQPPVLVVSMLARHFRILTRAREVGGRIRDRGEMARYLGVHPFFAKNYIVQAQNFATGELKKSFRTLHRCDREIKSSRVPRERILERALFDLIGK